MGKVEEFKPTKGAPPATEQQSLPCALHRIIAHVSFHCLCLQAATPPQPPTLLCITGPDHVVQCPHCRLEYFLDFLHYNREDVKLDGQIGISIKWRVTSGIVRV